MPEIKLLPLAGMDTITDDQLMINNDTGRVSVRDAVNVNITPGGNLVLRDAPVKVSDTTYKNLWQSPLHRDVFATLNDDWVKVSLEDWSYEALCQIGEGHVAYTLLNNKVCASGKNGIFVYDGQLARTLTITTPPAPMVNVESDGSLPAGRYGVAIAWLRAEAESATSAIAFVDLAAQSKMDITFPLCLDAAVTGVRTYFTACNGSELLRGDDYLINTTSIDVPLLPERGAPAQFMYLSAMPSGRYLCYWRGRLVTATANIIRFSEPLAYHLHDERYGFVQLPQRVTFVMPTAGGLWVGQTTHVVFLAGTSPTTMTIHTKASQAPIPGSAFFLSADMAGNNLDQSGGGVVAWLSENGYIAGTADGGLVEIHSGKLENITGNSASSVGFERRVMTAVT